MSLLSLWLAACGTAPTPSPQPGPEPAIAEPVPVAEPAPTPAIPPPPPGPAWLAVEGVGVVRIAVDGQVSLAMPTAGSIKDLWIGDDGAVWVAGDRAVRIAADGKVEDLRRDDVLYLAVGHGTAWAIALEAVGQLTPPAPWVDVKQADLGIPGDLLMDIAVGPDETPWISAMDGLYHRGTDGAWSKATTPVPITGPIRDIERAADGRLILTAESAVQILDGSGWRAVPLPSLSSVDAAAMGPTGVLGVIANLDVALVPPVGEPKVIAADIARYRAATIADIAVDGAGRAWVAADHGLAILGPDGALLAQWTRGTIPLIRGPVSRVAVQGSGPTALPILAPEATGTVRGTLVGPAGPLAGVDLEVCLSPRIWSDGTPCAGGVAVHTAKTDEKGRFTLTDMPIGGFGIAVREGEGWTVVMGFPCCGKLQPGGTLDLGTLTMQDL
jgi:hypothetical protein